MIGGAGGLVVAAYTRVATRLPGILWRAHRRCRVAGTAFDRVVAPVVAASVTDPARRDRVTGTLRPWGAKGSHIVASYAAMVGTAFPVELCVAGACFARVYDDLLDTEPVGQAEPLADRLGRLFTGGGLTATTDLERLLVGLYDVVAARLAHDRPATDPIFSALRRLHGYQTASQAQRTGAIGSARLLAVTLGKGGLSLLVLCALAHPGMPRHTQEAIVDLGGQLQLVDDYADAPQDRRGGVATPATTARLGFLDLFRGLARVRPRVCGLYERTAAAFFDEIHLFLVIALIGRRLRRSGSPSAPRRRRWALLELLERGGNVAHC